MELKYYRSLWNPFFFLFFFLHHNPNGCYRLRICLWCLKLVLKDPTNIPYHSCSLFDAFSIDGLLFPLLELSLFALGVASFTFAVGQWETANYTTGWHNFRIVFEKVQLGRDARVIYDVRWQKMRWWSRWRFFSVMYRVVCGSVVLPDPVCTPSNI